MKKLCTDCGKKKDLELFGQRGNPNKTKTTYYTPYCKACMVKRTTEWVKANKKKHNAYQSKYHKEHYALRG